MPQEKFQNFISLQEATEYCNYSQEYLSLRARQGKLKAKKIGRNWLTKKEWLEEYLQEIENYNNQLIVKKEEIAVVEKLAPKEIKPSKKIFPGLLPLFRFGVVATLLFILLFSGLIYLSKNTKQLEVPGGQLAAISDQGFLKNLSTFLKETSGPIKNFYKFAVSACRISLLKKITEKNIREKLIVIQKEIEKLKEEGVYGFMGPQGPVGLAGPAGPTGPTGIIGPSGSIGPMGFIGPVGPRGDRGPEGPPGATGADGTWKETILTTRWGGTGQDFSSIVQGSIIYFSTAGTMATLAPTTSGYVLATQGPGANPTWAVPSALGTYQGTTTSSYDGDINYGADHGYKAADALCNADFAGSHMCSTAEILYTINIVGVSGLPDGTTAWINNGPPGYLANANDCLGHTSNSNTYLGAFWLFANDDGGEGWLIACSNSKKIACCK